LPPIRGRNCKDSVNDQDLIELLRTGVDDAGGEWADLGSGAGAFTLALRELAPTASIHAVDKDAGALRRLREAAGDDQQLHILRADFTRALELPPLDGLLMANSLHFIRDKRPVLALVRRYLKPQGRLIMIEYDADHGNPWVPYPISYQTWSRMATENGFVETRFLHRVPSRHLGGIYSALSVNP
jgi:ubiquinone/menaquinone biosynthesis C-methylase UbiE